MIRFGKIVYHHGHEVLYEENRPDLRFGIDIVGLFGFGYIEHYVSLVYTDGFTFGYEDALCHTHGYTNHYGDASHSDLYWHTDFDGLRLHGNSIGNCISYRGPCCQRAHWH
jgi:hypothetical protein